MGIQSIDDWFSEGAEANHVLQSAIYRSYKNTKSVSALAGQTRNGTGGRQAIPRNQASLQTLFDVLIKKRANDATGARQGTG